VKGEGRSVKGEQTAQLVRALRDPRCYPHPVENVRLIETHISYVLLTGEFAYKLKKPVNLGFLDFSTIQARYSACQEELRLNRRTAPRIYLSVVPITGSARAPVIGGEGTAIDHMVKMREFPADALMSDRLTRGTLTPANIDDLATGLAAFHQSATRATDDDSFGTPAAVRARLVEAMAFQDCDEAPLRRRNALQGWIDHEGARLADVMARRKADGFVRECHGDLHLANIAMIDGMPVPFDCIEFNADLRFGDVMGEVAFTFMDFVAHGRHDYAWRFLNGYLERTGDYAGMALLRLYAVYRAMVRCKVATIRAEQLPNGSSDRSSTVETAERYGAIAWQITAVTPPALILMHGLSGSGKSTVASMAAESIGAIRVRSDVERKRLCDLAANARTASTPGGGLYAPAITRSTYDRLAHIVRTLMGAGHAVIVDATFQSRSERSMFQAIATGLGRRFVILDCAAPVAVLRERIAARSHESVDASEADERVLEHQLRHAEPLTADELVRTISVDTACSLAALSERCAVLPAQISASSVDRDRHP
jgi:uncharacterized protein